MLPPYLSGFLPCIFLPEKKFSPSASGLTFLDYSHIDAPAWPKVFMESASSALVSLIIAYYISIGHSFLQRESMT